MKATDLGAVSAGFSDPALGSQTVFRAALQALSHPGRPVDVTHDAEAPVQGHAAAAVLLLALLDPDCRLWLSPSLANSDAAHWLRFHCGCELVDEPARAQFAWVAACDELPALERFAQGSDTYPDQSTTCVLEVPSFVVSGETSDVGGWRLRGPGIRGQAHLNVGGLTQEAAARLIAQRSLNHEAFPHGVDLFLATPHQIVGLPRTTRIELEA